MPIEAEAADGTILEFPDGTPDNVIDGAMKKYVQSAPPSATTRQPTQAGFLEARDVGSFGTGANKMIANTLAFPIEASAFLAENLGINDAYESLTGRKARRDPIVSGADVYEPIKAVVGETEARPGSIRDRYIQAAGAGTAGAVMMNPLTRAVGITPISQTAAAAGGATGGVGGQIGSEVGGAVGGPVGAGIGGVIGSVVGGGLVPASIAGPTATVRTGAALARPLTQSGREAVVGKMLNDAGRAGTSSLQDEALPGLNATLGQRTGNRGLLALEKTVAQGGPDVSGRFHEGLSRGQAMARDTLERLRGNGVPQRTRDVAEQQVAQADNAAVAELQALQSGRSPAQASDLARQRINATREGFRTRETELWDAIDAGGDGAMVAVDPLRTRLRAFLTSQPKAYDNAMPQDVQAAFLRLNPREPLSEITPIRTMLREEAQAARAANNPRMARIYGHLEREVGNYLDNLNFADEGVQRAYQEARNFTRHRAQLFNQQDEVRGTLAVDKFGGQRTSNSETLGNFIEPGTGGRDKIRQLMSLDDTPEMRSLIADHFVAAMPEGARQAQGWLRRFDPALSELPQLRNQLRSVVMRRAAADALRETPMAGFAGLSPDKAIQRLVGSPDAVNSARQLRTQLQPHAGAWNGVQAAYADDIAKRIGSLVEQDAAGRPTILPSKIASFVRDHDALSGEILGAQGRATLRNISQAMQMITRTSRGGYPGGSDTFSKISGSRFIDRILEGAMSEKTPAAAGTAGFGVGAAIGGPFVGGPVGAALGYGGGAATRSAYTNARQQIDQLLADALLNPELGRSLMVRASRQNLAVLPRGARPYLTQYAIGASAGAAANSGDQSEDRRGKATR